MSYAFSNHVERILKEKYFAEIDKIDRPFSVFGYVDHGKYYGGGKDNVYAENVCGYSKILLENIYCTRIKPHFHCNLNIATDSQIQLALRAIHGLHIDSLSEVEKEHAAKAIECGYLYREDELLYTKILVSDAKKIDKFKLFEISQNLNYDYFDSEAEMVAEKIADMIYKNVPKYLLPEWNLFNAIANMPVLDNLIEVLIEKNILIPPEDGIGAEGCWMCVAE